MNKVADADVMSWWQFFIKNRISQSFSFFKLIWWLRSSCKSFMNRCWLLILKEFLLSDKQTKLFQHFWQFRILTISIDRHSIVAEKHEKFRIDCNQKIFNRLRSRHLSNFILHDINYRLVSFFYSWLDVSILEIFI